MSEAPNASEQPEAQHITSMPLEVVAMILAYLPQTSLRRASTISQQFYEAAHVAGLTLHRRIKSLNSDDLMNFILVVKHALAHRLPFKLSLTLVVNCREDDRAAYASSLGNTMAAIRSAMPRLASLHATFPGHFAEAIYNGLRESAPILRELELVQTDAQPAQIPLMLFAGKAARLRTLTLDVPALEAAWPRIPAFNHVRVLVLRLGQPTQRLAVARFFRQLQELTVVAKSYKHNDAVAVVDISGMTLQRLTVDNDVGRPLQFSSLPSAPRATIGEVEQLISELQYDRQFWPADDCELNAHVQSDLRRDKYTHYTGTVVAINSTDSAWRHTQYTLPKRRTAMLTPLERFPPLSARLVSLTVDEAMLDQLVQTPRTLAVLRELCVDGTELPNVPSTSQLIAPGPLAQPLRICNLRCPVLALVTFFVTNSKPVAISCPKLVTLGRLLGQTPRAVAVPARAALVLVHAKIDMEKHREALEKVFSSVRLEDPDQRWVPAYYHPRHYDPRRA
ncbi:hypothetical protein AURDEDRAFT_163737 [Auricularia subglabra TFB-10046 SS5]|nr:hypothetical protein AURDEDRAFT_163737 [Auricularia subglabra TFB-10046 SS5]